MKTKKILKPLALFLITGLIISSCRKDNIDDKDTQSASDFEQAEFISNDALNMADAAGNGFKDFRLSAEELAIDILSSCATVTFDTVDASNADTITIDFGPTNCQGPDGRNRRGIITIIRNGDKFTAGSYRIITFNNYYVNDNHIEGTHTVTAKGQNGNGNYNWDINAQNMKITRTNGKWHSWNSTRNREMIAGLSTLARIDDVFLITGSGGGTNSNGGSYTALITKELRRELNCKWFVSGTVVVTPANKPQRTLNFGNGNCDNQATVTINGNTYNITLH
jgi:hypothetical protein